MVKASNSLDRDKSTQPPAQRSPAIQPLEEQPPEMPPRAGKSPVKKLPLSGTIVHIGGESVSEIHFKGDPQKQIDRRLPMAVGAVAGHIAVFDGEHGDRVRDSGYSIDEIAGGGVIGGVERYDAATATLTLLAFGTDEAYNESTGTLVLV